MYDDDKSFALEYRLRELDPQLHKRFTDCVFGLQKLLSNYKLIFPEFTDHTEMHSITVIDFSRRLIGDQLEKLNKTELYVMLLGCYFHDVGMGITKKDFDAFSSKIDFGDYMSLHPDADMPRVIRDFHNEFSGLFIRKYAEFFELPSEKHLEAVIQISRGHRKTDLMDETVYPTRFDVPGGDSVCLPYLAALIRLADEIDVTAARNPVLLYDIEAITDEITKTEHKKHKTVHDLLLESNAFTLVYDDSDEDMNENIKLLAKKMQRTLDQCRAAVNGRTPYVITQSSVKLLPLRNA